MKTPYENSPILLIEDNPVDVDLTLRAFNKQHVTNNIIVARDGAQAVAQIKKWDKGSKIPIVILLDLKLPKIDGLEVLRVFKTHPKYKTIPVVVLTSSSNDKDIENAYELGVNSYIVKPVNFDKFMEVAAQIKLYWMALNNSKLS
ncbi:response regulator [Lutibacter sp.]|uniref:response regulator n=1 Tax=Lutibacter sp. TaxID=1925666 RepID=UPI001A2E3400|nr:response regulator [Lutibacter sp.]MBI9041938.1 response regulator [Lutibacter sp.]